MTSKGDTNLHNTRDASLSALRAALIEGETSGVAAPFDFDVFVAHKKGKGIPKAAVSNKLPISQP